MTVGAWAVVMVCLACATGAWWWSCRAQDAAKKAEKEAGKVTAALEEFNDKMEGTSHE